MFELRLTKEQVEWLLLKEEFESEYKFTIELLLGLASYIRSLRMDLKRIGVLTSAEFDLPEISKEDDFLFHELFNRLNGKTSSVVVSLDPILEKWI